MKVAHISFLYGLNHTGGAAIAATRLHQSLLKHGVMSYYICVHQRESGVNVYRLPCGLWRPLFFLLTKLIRCILRFTPCHCSICLNVVPLFGLEKLLARIKPDVVHVQWINADVCSFEQLAKLPYKVVFNLHDLFVLNAIQPYPRKDRRLVEGFRNENSSRIERWLFGRKAMMVERASPVFIGPSQWVCGVCRHSIIGRNARVFAIPNIIDERWFGIENKRKESFSSKYVGASSISKLVTLRQFIVLFGAFGGRRNPDKGFDDLVRALELLPADVKQGCELRIFGECATDYEIDGVKVKFLGEIKSVDQMIDVYLGADLFAFPSREETQGMTKVEAMLCGLPVVAFDRTACAEGIVHRETGWIAVDGDYQSFVDGILYYYSCWKTGRLNEMRKQIASQTRSRFLPDALVCQVIKVYN